MAQITPGHKQEQNNTAIQKNSNINREATMTINANRSKNKGRKGKANIILSTWSFCVIKEVAGEVVAEMTTSSTIAISYSNFSENQVTKWLTVA